MGSADAKTVESFGDVVGVPTLLIFDSSGKAAGALYGAPPNLHEKIEKTPESLVRR